MNAYREFWNELLFGTEGLGVESNERYWYAVLVFVAVGLAIGLTSRRLPLVAPIATLAIVGHYLAALVPFMVWTLSCSDCGASFSYDTARSGELLFLHMLWGGFFAMGAAAIWLGVLVSRSLGRLFPI
jgi:hypothetical protein